MESQEMHDGSSRDQDHEKENPGKGKKSEIASVLADWDVFPQFFRNFEYEPSN
jgi:hypothetical protein